MQDGGQTPQMALSLCQFIKQLLINSKTQSMPQTYLPLKN
jgi:hypothetical protein